MIKLDRYPGGKTVALTMSYDDGRKFDRRLVEIFNQNGIKGTFHLNSGKLGCEGYITAEEVGILYRGHEVSCHTVMHPFLEKLPQGEVIREISEDRATLERLSGGLVRGMSYPFGTYNRSVIDLLKACGMEYSRTVAATNAFGIPENFMCWHPTCHHQGCLEALERLDATLEKRSYAAVGALFYVWGHSYEFDTNRNWELIETFARKAGGRENFWYATNLEVMDYVLARQSLRISSDRKMLYNPSCRSVWVSNDQEALDIPAGKTVTL